MSFNKLFGNVLLRQEFSQGSVLYFANKYTSTSSTNAAYAAKLKLQPNMDEKIVLSIENEEIKPRHHPGVMKIKIPELPVKVSNTIRGILRDQPLKALVSQGEALQRYLAARHPPLEEMELMSKIQKIKQSLESEDKTDVSQSNAEKQERLESNLRHKIGVRLKQNTYSWQPIVYNEYKAMQYLVGRTSAEYSVLCKIFSEIKTREENFKPSSIFDFGSGIGSASWAASSLWKKSLKEFFNVDTSCEMNDLASLILREGKEDENLPKGVFFRQFLPSSHKIKYDLVVSAYTLLELPSSASRLETVLNLWNKSQDFLVLVEQGTNAGFRVLNEARDYILHVANHSTTPQAHVFAPCPHEHTCPRMTPSKIPCNFEVSYYPLSFGKQQDLKRERFSYVVLRKGQRAEDDPQWPRVVGPVLTRSKLAICRLCHSEGDLGEISFTASKHGRIPYRCAKSSNWGDLLPMKVHTIIDFKTKE